MERSFVHSTPDDNEETSEKKKRYFMASALGHIKSLKDFLDCGIPIETRDYVFGETIFIRACRHNHYEVLEFLHHRGANVNAASHGGETALHIAVKNNSLHCVKYLLSIPHLDINYPDILGQTPLLVAACKGRVKCVEILLASASCDATLQDVHGRTALHKTLNPYDNIIGKNNAFLCVQLLTATLCDINHSDSNGETPLHVAVENSNWNAVKWLVYQNCQVDKAGAPNKDLAIFHGDPSEVVPTTALLLALNFLNKRVVKFLVASGCSSHCYFRFLSYCSKDVGLYQFMVTICSQPTNLRNMCRNVIRCRLGRNIKLKLQSLSLPEYFHDFLLLKNLDEFS